MEEKLVDFIKEMTDYLLISHLKKLLEVLARALTEKMEPKSRTSQTMNA